MSSWQRFHTNCMLSSPLQHKATLPRVWEGPRSGLLACIPLVAQVQGQRALGPPPHPSIASLGGSTGLRNSASCWNHSSLLGPGSEEGRCSPGWLVSSGVKAEEKRGGRESPWVFGVRNKRRQDVMPFEIRAITPRLPFLPPLPQ